MKTFFRSLLLILALLGLLMFLSSCGVLKSIGSLASGMPKEQGEHWDVGYGWNKNITPGWQDIRYRRDDELEFFDGGEKLEKFQSLIIPVKGRVVRRLYNLSPSESKAAMLDKIGRSPFKLVKSKYSPADYIEYVDECNPNIVMVDMVDKSDYETKNRYGLFEFTFKNPGMYAIIYATLRGTEGFIIFKIE